MGKIMQADTFHGQTMFLNWRGYHANYNNGALYDSGWSTNLAYPYATIIPPFKGCINKIVVTDNPYSSFTSGPDGSSATARVLVNGTQTNSLTVYYTSGNAKETIIFDFGENAVFNANDQVRLQFQANGYWRYMNVGIQIKGLA